MSALQKNSKGGYYGTEDSKCRLFIPCINKDCEYRKFNGGDDTSDFYFCEYVGVNVDRGNDECLLDKYRREDIYEKGVQ